MKRDRGRRQKEHLISRCDRRQWRRASIRVPSFIQDEENSLGDGNTTAAREGADMAVWIMRRLQSLPCQGFTLARAATATNAGSVATPINDRQGDVLRARRRAHALNHGGAIV